MDTLQVAVTVQEERIIELDAQIEAQREAVRAATPPPPPQTTVAIAEVAPLVNEVATQRDQAVLLA